MGSFSGFIGNRPPRRIALTQDGLNMVKANQGDGSESTPWKVLYALYNNGSLDYDDLASTTHREKEQVRAAVKTLETKGLVEVR